jgi:hypothetical protein
VLGLCLALWEPAHGGMVHEQHWHDEQDHSILPLPCLIGVLRAQKDRQELLAAQRKAVMASKPPLAATSGILQFVVVRCYRQRVLLAPRVDGGAYETVPGYMSGDGSHFGFALGWSETWPLFPNLFEGATSRHPPLVAADSADGDVVGALILCQLEALLF